jgi:hypothetical protein
MSPTTPTTSPSPPAPPASRRPAIPDAVWTPLAVATLTLIPGLVGLATGRILLFPSLGPTALLQAHTPEHPSARPYNVIVSHLAALGAGFAAVTAFGLATAPSVFEAGRLSPERLGAAVVAAALAVLIELLLRASHPPAASTTLLVALGSFKPTVRDATAVVLGVLIVAAAGELVRRARRRGTPPVR